MEQLERVMVWHLVSQPGIEHCTVLSDETGWRLEGTVVTALAGKPTRVRYSIHCDLGWNTRQVRITMYWGTERTQLTVSSIDADHWTINDSMAEFLIGCTDIDLGVTPSTNTLPINRLKLAVGAAAEINAAMILFPTLEINPARQRYTRLDAQLYRYEGLDTRYVSELTVNDLGLVTDYAGGWTLIAES